MKRFTLLLIRDPEPASYTVEVPTLPGCLTEGDTIDEAIANAREAIAAWIKSAELDGEEVPEEGSPPQAVTIEVAA